MSASATASDHVQRMLEQIRENYTERLTLGWLARHIGRQSAYLGRLFREEVGVTVHEYVTRMRLNEAATQVGAGVKVEAVALGMGYKSKKNFYRQFKRRFGCTPEVYRRRQDEPAPLAPVDVTARRHTVALQAVPSARRAPDAAGVLVFVARQIRLEAGRLTAVTPAAKQLLVALELAVLVTDAADRCIGANRAAVTITGYSATELSGMPAATLFPDRPPASQRQLLLPLSGAAPLASDVLLHTKRGGVVHVYLARTENLLAAPPADLRGETASVA